MINPSKQYDSHSIESAMRREELTEEEAYFILRFAGRMGYSKAIKRLSSPLKNLRQWFIWIGGWENSELGQWDRERPAWEIFRKHGRKTVLSSPTPVSILGHRITFFGNWAQMKWRGGYLVLSNGYAYGWPTRLYWSPDGTTRHADAKMIWSRRGNTP